MDKTAYLMKISFLLLPVVIVDVAFADINITFERVPRNYQIFKGNTVRLFCHQEIQDLMSISRDGTAIVENSVFVGSSLRYSFDRARSGNVFIVTIHHVAKNDEGRYYCAEGIPLIKQLYLEVLYNPMSGPNCTSSYGGSTIFFDDASQQKFYFYCTVEDGNPEIKFLLLKDGKDTEKLDPVGITVVNNTEKSPQKTLMFSSYLNSSFNNSRLTCTVVQNFPSTFVGYDFNETCTYGPMKLLPTFDISVTPSNVSVREGDVTLLSCSSNVSNVAKKWRDIPKGLVHETEEDEIGLNLTILEMKAVGDQSFTVVCECSLGERQLSAEATINILRDQIKESKTTLVVMLVIIVLVVLFVMISFYGYKRKQHSNRKHDDPDVHRTQENTPMNEEST